AHDWLTMEAGVRAKELTGAPLIVHVHATEFDRSGELSGNPLVHEIEYQGLIMADRIIAVSEITRNIIMERYSIPGDKIEVMHNAIDLNDMGEYADDPSSYKCLVFHMLISHASVAVVTGFTGQNGLTQFVRAAARASKR